MIKRVAVKISRGLRDNRIINEGDEDIYVYGMELLLSTVVNFMLLLSLGGVFNRFWETVAFLAVYCSIRYTAGGYHAKSHGRCILTFLVFYTCIMLYFMVNPIEKINSFMLIGWIVSFVGIYFFSPCIGKNVPVDEQERRRLKMFSRRNMMVLSLVLGGLYMMFPIIRWALVYGVMGFITVGVFFYVGMLMNMLNESLGERK